MLSGGRGRAGGKEEKGKEKGKEMIRKERSGEGGGRRWGQGGGENDVMEPKKLSTGKRAPAGETLEETANVLWGLS